MKIKSNIFREYDIRGVVDEELTPEAVYAIAKAFAAQAAARNWRRVLLGRDNRESSPRIRDIAVAALLDSGCEVVDIGVVVTPIFYFAARHLNLQAGLMITASHNAAEYNGVKVLLGEGTIYGQEIQDLRLLAEKGEFVSGGQGQVEELDVIEDYLRMVTGKIIMGPRPLKIVIDCGNGTASLFAPRLVKALGCEVVELYCDSDPTFPHHHPDPVNADNLQDLIRMVQREKADLGIGFDGDGDRLGVIDRHGNIINGDILMILFWREILPKYPGITCIVEVKCSQSLIDEIEKLGGRPLIYKTGHSLIKAKMREIGAVFTGEMSGHMFFADEYYGYDDALYAAARLLRILSRSDRDIDVLLEDIPRYHSTPEIRVKATDEEKFTIVKEVLEHYRSRFEVIDIDGARILFPNGWGLVRASNTGPHLIVRCEGKTPEDLRTIRDEIFGFLRQRGLEI